MKILITGGSGLIGTALTQSLLNDGHNVIILTRIPGKLRLPPGASALAWDGRTSRGWLPVLETVDAVVNLAGATIGRWPWTAEYKKEIEHSRIGAGRALLEAFEKTRPRPRVLIQSSGVGYYGVKAPLRLTEDAPAGDDFLASLATTWEQSTRLAETMGIRRCTIRTGIVLARHGGVLPLMALPVQLMAGGPIGTGKQGMSWIHLQDQVRAIRFLIDNDTARGAFNLCAPNPVSNAAFMRSLAEAMRRPYWLPAPAFAMRLALGEMSTLLLDGQFAIPQKLIDLGFIFDFDNLPAALENIYNG